MTSDGTTTYTYDALSRVASYTAGGSTRTNTYNGDGTLVAQMLGGTTTRYVQDLAAPLSQVLSSGGVNYIYGNERLYASTSGTKTWYGGDALGSVRQTLNDAGAVQSTINYDPWGQVQSGTVPTFGFTGEQQDGSLVNLRARWYNASRGVFTSRDSFAGDPGQPSSLNPYSYVLGNPILLTDPSGHCGTTGTGDDYCRPTGENPRNITLWLYRVMMTHLSDPTLLMIRKTLSDPAPTPCPLLTEPLPFQVWANQQGAAFTVFKILEQDHGPWDFKHAILFELGPGVTLCSTAGCADDIEYSVAGNIHYGFVGRGAGFTEQVLGAGAGVAEWGDPAHDRNRAAAAGSTYAGPYDPWGKFGPQSTPFDTIQNYGDDPTDNIAVMFGSYLYGKYGAKMTYPPVS